MFRPSLTLTHYFFFQLLRDISTKLLLQESYNVDNEDIPQQCKSDWKSENKFGFLLGIIEYEIDTSLNYTPF